MVTVKADTPSQDEYFAGWVKTGDSSGTIISKEAEYSFFIYENTDLTATYVKAPPKEEPYVALSSSAVIKQTDGIYRLIFVGKVVPFDATIIEFGFVYKNGVVTEPSELEIGAVDSTTKRCTRLFPTNEYSVRLDGVAEGQSYSYRSYMTYSLNGQQTTVYSNEIGVLTAREVTQ